MDQYLRWDKHVEYLRSKLNKAIFGIKSIRQITNEKTATLAYHGMFHSIISYGTLIWGNATLANDLFKLQKKALRAIYNMPQDASCRKLFKQTNVMTLPSIYIYEILKFVKLNLSKFKLNENVHNWNTRKKNDIRTNLRTLKVTQRDVMHMGALMYNKLPKDIVNLTFNSFKAKIKKLLISCEFYQIEDYLKYGLSVPWQEG